MNSRFDFCWIFIGQIFILPLKEGQSISDRYSRLGDASFYTDTYLDDIFLILIFEHFWKLFLEYVFSLIWILLPEKLSKYLSEDHCIQTQEVLWMDQKGFLISEITQRNMRCSFSHQIKYAAVYFRLCKSRNCPYDKGSETELGLCQYISHSNQTHIISNSLKYYLKL